MANANFDKAIRKTFQGSRVTYGFLRGSDTIVLIKNGAGGTCRAGKHKHLKMALRLRELHGYSVICASNPLDNEETYRLDKKVLADFAAEQGFASYRVYLVGTSDGGDQILKLAMELHQTEKLLAINPSVVALTDMAANLRRLPQVEKQIFYGTLDDEVALAPLLKAENIPNLQIDLIPGADHRFTGMVDTYITLADRL